MTATAAYSLSSVPDEVSTDLGAAAGRLAGSVRACLPWTGMSRIPRHYEAFAAGHFHRLSAGGAVTWTDACPAYALAYLTHSAYGPGLDDGETGELEAQWDELRGTSDMDWSSALDIVQEAWLYLAIRPQP